MSADAYIIGISGLFANKKFGFSNRVIIGRDRTKCNIVFPDGHDGISAVHCEVKISGGIAVLKDHGSSCGTYVPDGVRLEPGVPMVLCSGGKFWVGSKDNIFEVKY